MRIIEVVPWSAEWSAHFEHEAGSLRAVFGERVQAIHHIGSTSVPGLAAKPIIDALVVLDSTDDVATFDAPMERLGYAVKGECLDAEIPGTRGRFYYSRTVDDVRTHQVHACQSGHPQVAELLAFRDYLRAYPDDAAEYARVKTEAARVHRESNLDYMRAKDGVIRLLLARARAWSAGEG